jgi:chromosome segregation ATPase
MTSKLDLKLLQHRYEQRSTEHAITQHSQDITKNEKELETAKKQLKDLNESMHTSEIRKSVLTTQIKKYEQALKTIKQNHSKATRQRQTHDANIKATEAALLHAKKQPKAAPMQIPADFLQGSKALQKQIKVHDWMTNEQGYSHSPEDGLYHDKNGKAHTLKQTNGRFRIEEYQ